MPPPVRLAALLGGLSLAADFANGFPPEKVLRTALIGRRLAEAHGLGAEAQRDAFYLCILRFLGCTAFGHEEAHVYGDGDDIGTRNVMSIVDAAQPLDAVSRMARGIGTGGTPWGRARAVARILGDGKAMEEHARAQCDAGARLAEIIGFGAELRGALLHVCERWDGKGAPARRGGAQVALPARVLHLADLAEIVAHRVNAAAARDEVARRAGGHLDPALCATFAAHATHVLSDLDTPSVWDAFLDAEPAPRVTVDEGRFDDVAVAFAHLGDMKSVYTLGHSPGVADLAARAAELSGATPLEIRTTRRAALLHDLGRVAVPNSCWDKKGRLTAAEWERVRLHSYYTERILSQSPELRELGQIAAAAHERLDGHGYHRAIPGSLLSRPARWLAAADAHRAMREPRPHRPALAAEVVRRELLRDVRDKRLDETAVQAVLEAASGRRTPRAQTQWPSGLSDREVQVLRRVARGSTNKEIGADLGISAKTVQHHVAHVYEKIRVASRAGAALFATEHALLEPE